jgi:D-cysteine desulfhydrase
MPYLHEWSPVLRETLPHRSLGKGPTPVLPAAGLTDGDAEVWVKDESEFGDGGWGGNKVRKLEWLLPDAKSRGKRTVLTFGALGTNWGLATALYARDAGIDTVLALIDQPVDDHVRRQLGRLEASGATLHFTHSKARTVAMAPWLVVRHSSRLKTPYILPAGGSSPLGTLGYVETAMEIAAQVRAGELPEPGHVIVPAGSGGTTAGLALGLALSGIDANVIGVVVTDALRLDHEAIEKLAGRSARLLADRGAGFEPPALAFEMTTGFLGPGYGVPTPESSAALERAREAGLELDPVYTAKAMAALLALNAAGELGDRPVLFLNTNGPR